MQAPTENQPGIIAFHGSGADFDRFRLDKIGTGEGAQAFGYGLYFTDSEDIAKFYKNQVSRTTFETTDGKVFDPYNVVDGVRTIQNLNIRSFISKDGDVDGAISLAKRLIKDIPSAKDYKVNNLPLQGSDTAKKDLKLLENIKKKGGLIKKTGKTYKVALAPKPDELLDYDLPLGQQNKFIKERLLKVVNEMTVDDAINLGFDPFDFGNNNKAAINAAKKEMLKDDQSVVAFLNNWAVFRGEQSTGEKLLNKHGIKGIKYKANQGVGARNVPETGANNYVIFDENLINILAKYGIVGSVGITAMGNDDGS